MSASTDNRTSRLIALSAAHHRVGNVATACAAALRAIDDDGGGDGNLEALCAMELALAAQALATAAAASTTVDPTMFDEYLERGREHARQVAILLEGGLTGPGVVR